MSIYTAYYSYTYILQSKAFAYSIVISILFLKFSSSPGIAAKPNSPFVTSPIVTIQVRVKEINYFYNAIYEHNIPVNTFNNI